MSQWCKNISPPKTPKFTPHDTRSKMGYTVTSQQVSPPKKIWSPENLPKSPKLAEYPPQAICRWIAKKSPFLHSRECEKTSDIAKKCRVENQKLKNGAKKTRSWKKWTTKTESRDIAKNHQKITFLDSTKFGQQKNWPLKFLIEQDTDDQCLTTKNYLLNSPT